MITNDQLATNLEQLSDLYILQNLLVQIQINLALIQQGAAGQTIVVNGGSLYQLASQYYGDATAWTTIAKANNLADPMLRAGNTITLVIPAQNTETGGIYQS